MSISQISLSDQSMVQFDGSGRSGAFFCKNNPVRIDQKLILDLKAKAKEIGDKNIRLCLHMTPEAVFHQMIILEHKSGFYPPHKHLLKGEAFHMIEGSMAVFVFDDAGNISDACRLEGSGTFMYRVDVGQHHSVMPLSDIVIYHEGKPGPFLGNKDSLFPDWAPDVSSANAIAEYKQKLIGALELES